ncbi:MAG: potassium transporter TrkA, partial [Pseudomonadota bacterium]|nr:potassium transporter TrkA [Pseudomonadota bacterium]
DSAVLGAGRTALSEGDRILFCGSIDARRAMEWTLQNENILRYAMTGSSRPPQRVWQVLRKAFAVRR